MRLMVRDRRGVAAPVAFYADDRGAEFTHQARSGFTVAILYAHQHGFLDMTVGVRLEENSVCKVRCPFFWVPVQVDIFIKRVSDHPGAVERSAGTRR